MNGVLSRGERRVVACAALGDTQRQTATRLGLSIETVKTQRKISIQKLEARNMTHAVAKAMRQEIIA